MTPPGNVTTTENWMSALYAGWLSHAAGKEVPYHGDPMSNVYYPVYDKLGEGRVPVMVLNAIIHWKSYFTGILPPNVEGVIAVLSNVCHGSYTYEINGEEAVSVGQGDLHDVKYNDLEISMMFEDLTKIEDGTDSGLYLSQDGCPYSIHVYPSDALYNEYNTNKPIIFTVCVAMTFLFTAMMFVLYDRLVGEYNTAISIIIVGPHITFRLTFSRCFKLFLFRLQNVASVL